MDERVFDLETNPEVSLVVLVTGSRRGVPRKVSWELDELVYLAGVEPSAVLVVHGDAPGVDTEARNWASNNGACAIAVPADWSVGKKAGPLRNQRMVDAVAAMEGVTRICLAFPREDSRGTWDCLKRAAKAGIPGSVIPL